MFKSFENKKRHFYLEEKRYFPLKWKKKVFVVSDHCPHRGGPLSLGGLDKITCPWHGSKICVLRIIKTAVPTIYSNNCLTVYVGGG